MKVDSIRIYPKEELLLTWRKRQEYQQGAEHPMACMRCGRPLQRRPIENALSRAVNVPVCPRCGTDEGLRDATGQVLVFRDWMVVKEGKLEKKDGDTAAILIPECSFSQIFTGPFKFLKFANVECPASELAYSRSDFNGRKWWTTWFRCEDNISSDELTQEVDSFQEALFALPEMTNLWTLRRMCLLYAEPTSEKTEFNLYSETENLNIWLRLITREKDYNVYAHFYRKGNVPGEDHQGK